MTTPDKDDAPLLQAAAGAFSSGGEVAVAVSGGGDSMALLHLMARIAAGRGIRLRAVTVDHALRPESAKEARQVARLCRTLGVSHSVLRWTHGPVTGNLQDQARQARYRLIAEWASGRGIAAVAVAHTADDQAETFLMEIAREAGLDGLSAMRPDWEEGGVRFLRPLLGRSRAELRTYLRRHGQDWIEDPSNQNDRFARVRARRALAALGPLGITPETLSHVTLNLARARAGLDAAVTEAALAIGREVAGEVILDRAAFLDLHPELARRLLLGCLKWVAGEVHPPRAGPLGTLLAAIREGKSRTLHGCRIRVPDAEIRILREPKSVAAAARPGEIWDGRWRLSGPPGRGLEVRALGADALRLCGNWRQTGASRDALIVSPAVFRGGRLVAAPLAGLANGWRAEPRRPFSAAFTRH